MKTKSRILVFLFSFLCCSLAREGVYAQSNDSGLSLVTSPLPVNLVTDPDSTVSAQLKVKNAGNSPEKIHVGLMKFSAYGDEGNPKLIDQENGDDYFNWVRFSENDFTLAPNEWRTVVMEISVPDTAAFGYYYAVTFSRFDDQTQAGQRSTKILGAVASLVLLEVRVPNAIRDVEVTEFTVKNRIFEFLPVNFEIKLKNKGNVHIAPRGNIFISRGGKKDEIILEINELKGNVLPLSSRNFETSWKDGFPIYTDKMENGTMATDRKGKPIQNLTWDFSQIKKLRWGKYTATMLLAYDDGQKDVPIEANLSFWVIPWRIIGAVMLLSLLVFDSLRNRWIRMINLFRKKK